MKSAIPSESDFEDFISLMSPGHLPELVALANTVKATREGAREYFSAWLPLCESHRNKIQRSVVWRWLKSQGSYQRALQATGIFSKRIDESVFAASELDTLVLDAVAHLTVPNDEDLGHKYAKRKWVSGPLDGENFVQWAALQRAPTARESAFRRHLYFYTSPRSVWLGHLDVAIALKGYYWGSATQDLRRIEAVSKHISVAKAEISSAVKASAQMLGNEVDNRLSILSRAAEQLQTALYRKRSKLPPATRRDSTLSERTLLWNLSRAFGSRNRQRNSTALFYMLGLDGIKRPLDQRNVERLLASWYKAKS
jgi:hypothetical protein